MDLGKFWQDLVSMIVWSGFFKNLLVLICCISFLFIVNFFGLYPGCVPVTLDAWC